jgi:hypothetical protein
MLYAATRAQSCCCNHVVFTDDQLVPLLPSSGACLVGVLEQHQRAACALLVVVWDLVINQPANNHTITGNRRWHKACDKVETYAGEAGELWWEAAV